MSALGENGLRALATSLFDRYCRKSHRGETVENEYATIESRKMDLNQRCALAPDLESILRARMRKILFRQYRPIGAVGLAVFLFDIRPRSAGSITAHRGQAPS